VIKPEEKYLLSRVVDVMVALELRLVQEKQEDGQMMYRLDPYVKYHVRSSIIDTIFQSHRCLRHLRRQASNGHYCVSLCNSTPNSRRSEDTKTTFQAYANMPLVD
jgi:hypothetical protein